MSKKEAYTITGEQLDRIKYFKSMFEINAQEIKDLCSTEKSDIEYGFALGSVYTHLRKHYFDMDELVDDIIINNLTTKS